MSLLHKEAFSQIFSQSFYQRQVENVKLLLLPNLKIFEIGIFRLSCGSGLRYAVKVIALRQQLKLIKTVLCPFVS